MDGAKPRILVTDGLNAKGLAVLSEGGLEPVEKKGLKEDELCAVIGDYEGLIVRSATKVTPKVIAAAGKLRIIGRAGAGVDNINLEAATQAGVVVENTPFGNIVSAAEHAVALLFAVARNINRADAGMRKGEWPKKQLTGVELTGKTIGIVGLGKAGSIVARVARALEMEILIYDPFVTEQKAKDAGAEKVELDELLAKSDFVSLHTPLTAETRDLFNKDVLAKMKKGARLVNAARGGIVVEEDLLEALANGSLAGAGFDVFGKEPLPDDSPLRSVENLVLTPHLGASTAEAQERVAEDIAKQFVEFFRDGVIRNAVNAPVQPNPQLAPYAKLAELLGSMAAQMTGEAVLKLKIGCYGRLAQYETKELTLSAVKGILARSVEKPVTLVNAPGIAHERGMELIERRSDQARTYASLLELVIETKSGKRRLAGTCYDGQRARIVGVDDFDIADLEPSQRLLIMFYPDQPGMVGKFGTILGKAQVNIASMAVGRREKHGQAVVALTLDDPVQKDVLKKLKKAVGATELYAIELPV
jgi:D-3-phosphoglycerate dehydrogenase